jgi:hypothetical protein
MNALFAHCPAALALSLLSMASAYAQDNPASAADVNRDGVVSQAEAEYSSALRLEFDDLDRNRDGRLDPTEISGLAPAPPGAVPVLPNSAIGRPAGTVVPGSGMTSGAATTGTVTGSVPGGGAFSGSAVSAPPMAPAVPDPSTGPASGSPFASPFSSSTTFESGGNVR